MKDIFIKKILATQEMRDFLFLSLAMVIFYAAFFVVEIVAARSLGPKTFGSWNVLKLIIIYGSFLHLGVLNGMGRELPYHSGAREFEKVKRVKETTFSIVLCAAGFFFIILMICGTIFHFGIEKDRFWFLLILVGFLFFGRQIQDFARMYLRSTLNFKFLSFQFMVSAVLLVILTVPLLGILRLKGYILGQTIAFVLAGWCSLRISHFNPSLEISKYELKTLIKIGFPIMMAGFLYNLLTSVDRWIIVGYLGTRQLGYYSLAIITLGVMTLLPRVISNLIYPQMAKRFGETRQERTLTHFIKKQFLGGYCVTIPVFLTFFLLFPLFVKRFMPAYIPGLSAMKIVLGGSLFLPLGYSFGDFLNTTGRQIYYLSVQGIAVIINLLFTYLFVVNLGMGIIGAAWGTVIAYASYSILLVLISYRFVF